MITREGLADVRRAAEQPQQPLVGVLGVTSADTYCDYCRGLGKDEDACALDATPAGTWVVAGRFGTYHVACAERLGWAPSPTERRSLADSPSGPYA